MEPWVITPSTLHLAPTIPYSVTRQYFRSSSYIFVQSEVPPRVASMPNKTMLDYSEMKTKECSANSGRYNK